MGWFRDFTNFVGITNPEPARAPSAAPPRTSDDGVVADAVDTIVVIGRRRRGGVLGWLERNIVDPVVDNVIKPVARFVTEDVPRIVTQDIPRIITRDAPAAAAAVVEAVDRNVIQPYVAPVVETVADTTNTIITTTMSNPNTRFLLMSNPILAPTAMGLYLGGTEEGRNHLGALGYGILHDALGQGLPALAGAVVDLGVGIEETKMDIYGGLWRAATTDETLEQAMGAVRMPWNRLTGNANNSYMQTWEKWGDENLGEWLTYPVGLADVEYRTSRDSFWDVEVSRDGERSWSPVGRSEQGALIVGNILDPTNLIGIGVASKARLGLTVGRQVISHGDDIIRHGDEIIEVGAEIIEETAEAAARRAPAAAAAASGGADDAARASAEFAEAAGPRVDTPRAAAPDVDAPPPRVEPTAVADDAARAGDDAGAVADDAARAGDEAGAAADDVAEAGADTADAAPRSGLRRVYDGAMAPVRFTGAILGGIVRDPYTMTELSMYAVAIGGPLIRDNFFPHEAIGDFYSILTDPNSLEGPLGERRLIDTLNIMFAREARVFSDREIALDGTLIQDAEGGEHRERLRALDRYAGLDADTGAFASTGDRHTAISRARLAGTEIFDFTHGGLSSEINVSTRGQELGLQIAFDGLVQRYMANPNMTMTRSETLLAQVMLAREGLGGGTLDQGATKQALGQYVEDNALTPALIEARRNGAINERNSLTRSDRDAAVQPPPAQPDAIMRPAATP